jgi:hypothetical protein
MSTHRIRSQGATCGDSGFIMEQVQKRNVAGDRYAVFAWRPCSNETKSISADHFSSCTLVQLHKLGFFVVLGDIRAYKTECLASKTTQAI